MHVVLDGSHDAGDWNVYYLYLHNIDFQEVSQWAVMMGYLPPYGAKSITRQFGVVLYRLVVVLLWLVYQNRSRCPETCRAIESIPRNYYHAFFSALAPNSHVTKHHGK